MRKRVSPQLQVQTSVNLSSTKPFENSFWSRLKRKIVPNKTVNLPEKEKITVPKVRVKPESKIAEEEKLSLWFIPARIGFILCGIYCVVFAAVGLLGSFSKNELIQPFFTLPFDNNFSSFYLLETMSLFALLSSLLFFHSARRPRNYSWFYFFMILIYIPYHFLSNLQKMQIELPQNFQNYLYFDTMTVSVFWGILILSIYPYIKTLSRNS